MFGQPLACLGGTVLGRQRGAQRVFFQLIGTALHGVDVPPTTRFKMKFASAVRGHVRKNGVDPLATEDADVMLMGLGRSVFCLEMVGRGVGDVGHVPQGAGEGGDGECGGRTCFGKHGWLVGGGGGRGGGGVNWGSVRPACFIYWNRTKEDERIFFDKAQPMTKHNQ